MKKQRTDQSKLRSLLRSAWLRSPLRNKAVQNARIERGRYLCAKCHKILNRKEFTIDHIDPCGKLDIEDVGPFTRRLFCSPNGLQALCRPCHKDKTAKGI